MDTHASPSPGRGLDTVGQAASGCSGPPAVLAPGLCAQVGVSTWAPDAQCLLSASRWPHLAAAAFG